MQKDELPLKFPIKPYSLKELAAMYHVTKKTFSKWLIPFEKEIGKRNGYYYNNNQVRIIFEKIGAPELVDRRNNRNSNIKK
ncbi:MAG: hypothetical protein ABIN74_03120 [Ferruginibacter sp.]